MEKQGKISLYIGQRTIMLFANFSKLRKNDLAESLQIFN